MSQPKAEIEKSYETPDPWQYQKTPDDIRRKALLIAVAAAHGPYERCLDIGAGEGWITADYPARFRWGFELSDNAAARFPAAVQRANPPEGRYDLVAANGIMYGHYDHQLFFRLIRQHASRHVLISSVAAWELPQVSGLGKVIFEAKFPYRERLDQRIRMFEVNGVFTP